MSSSGEVVPRGVHIQISVGIHGVLGVLDMGGKVLSASAVTITISVCVIFPLGG